MAETRQVFLGEAALASGFRLAGFEVYPDASVDTLERLLDELMVARSHAFVIIDQRLAESDSKHLETVRSEGGRILITQVPPLTRPEAMHSSVDHHIRQLLGLDREQR
jgi:vacuolar-type H+-ATPase subunit F/Vma7